MAKKMTHSPRNIDMLALFGQRIDPSIFEEDSLERAIAEDARAVEGTLPWAKTEQNRLAKLGYSKDALAHRLGELSTDAFSRIAKAERDLETFYKPRLEELRQGVEVQRAPEVSMVGELRAREIRERLIAMNPADVLNHFQRAVEQGDESVFSAVSSAPSVYESFGLPADLLALGEERWLEKRSPAVVKKIKRLDELVGRLEKSIRVAREELNRMTGAKEPDPLAEMGLKIGAKSLA